MAHKKADPLKSEGARKERKAIRTYLRRQMNVIEKADQGFGYGEYWQAFNQTLQWVLTRQKRYDKKVGGLGRK